MNYFDVLKMQFYKIKKTMRIHGLYSQLGGSRCSEHMSSRKIDACPRGGGSVQCLLLIELTSIGREQ